ncbi:kynurenine 3-monooxygenase, putative [Talaromyces stipitatus ATCC 10500]|uniref:Kynurenine 3-monooxygenase n=1 Tax=Talaromyces stipitatus (strain ATCC 10500 / CBS 375.48 / QM 6759 / NRRL 1006) TaxID=441959 RepID=B8MGS2_TALSN|nr:kynurenine 3-monooxygenase, putative [Talaromyces stipitatus ATCC 10500]EED16303.1 kynurenine 3-monooxygenase, putative [Talaromyces stipitatus ATCC 10500]
MAAPTRQKVVIVGAGPVGSLAALYAASRGDDVEVYELRADLRDPATVPLNFTKSINLALSERGIHSMHLSGRKNVVDVIMSQAIPMHGRMIHGRDLTGKLWQAAQAYDVHGQAINSIDRATLNNALLDELEKTPNVKLFFNHKLTGADFHARKAWFERRIPEDEHKIDHTHAPGSVDFDRAPEVEVSFDFLIGADGAHSASRYHMMKYARVDYQQEYIDALWCEFRIEPTEDNDFRISPNHLHIWPGKEFMFIALPSPDRSFTCTLFAPADHYARLGNTPEALCKSFQQYFPGVSPELISPEELYRQFTHNQHLPLISIKCKPHHYDASVVIIGDAAHAVLPFYGQGLNAGMEDVRVLFEILDSHGVYDPSLDTISRDKARNAAFEAYTKTRVADAYAINDLSKGNFIEMRAGVNSRWYKIRKFIEENLDRYMPELGWRTQYSRVSFSNMRYSEIMKAVERQRLLLTASLGTAVFATVVAGLALGGTIMWNHPRQSGIHGLLKYVARRR